MKAWKLAVIIAALSIVMASGFAASAATDPVPEPTAPIQLLTAFVPELMGLEPEQWLMTGYRFFYDVYYYDKDDNVTASETRIIDVVGRGVDYFLSEVYVATFDEEGELLTFEQVEYICDYPGVGEFWISLDAFRGKDAPALRDGTFYVESYSGEDYDQDAWYAYLMSEDGTVDCEYYYSMDGGTLLSLDTYSYDAAGNYLGGSAYKFREYYDYTAPWLDYGLMELPKDMELAYDIKVTKGDGSTADGVMTFKVLENYATWLDMSQTLKSEVMGDSEGFQVMSEMCTDGLILWLPLDALKWMEDEEYYFDEDVTGSYVKVGSVVNLEGFGEARMVSFKNGYFEADSYFRLDDGALVKYHQHPSDEKPFELVMTFKGAK